MNEEDIIELAKEAGVYTEWEDGEQWLVMPEACFPRFVELISDVVRKECAELIESADSTDTTMLAKMIREM
jgi:seryl-tRNA(Sec) selenium transferase